MDQFDSESLALMAQSLAVIARHLEPDWYPRRSSPDGAEMWPFDPQTGEYVK